MSRWGHSQVQRHTRRGDVRHGQAEDRWAVLGQHALCAHGVGHRGVPALTDHNHHIGDRKQSFAVLRRDERSLEEQHIHQITCGVHECVGFERQFARAGENLPERQARHAGKL
jgi:hypothetical protein